MTDHLELAGAYRPFRAVTRHADIMEIERNHSTFLNGRRSILTPAALEEKIDVLDEAGQAACVH